MVKELWEMLRQKIIRLQKKKEEVEDETENFKLTLESLKPIYGLISKRVLAGEVFIDSNHYRSFYSNKKYIVISGETHETIKSNSYKGFLGYFLGIYLDPDKNVFLFYQGEYHGLIYDDANAFILETEEISLDKLLKIVDCSTLRKILDEIVETTIEDLDHRINPPYKQHW